MVDSVVAATNEVGNLVIPIENVERGRDYIRAELGQMLTSGVPTSTYEHQITLYESSGLGVQNVAAAGLVDR